MTAAQNNAFTNTIVGGGTETIVISGDGAVTTLANIEFYSIADDSSNSKTITVSAATTNVTANSSGDAITFAISGLTYARTLTGDNTVADTLSVTGTSSISGATLLNVQNLTTAASSNTTMTAAQNNAFTGTITEGGSETITITGDGAVKVECSIKPSAKAPNIPRVGMQLAIPAVFETMSWFGRGPHETYMDRKTGAAVGFYSGKVGDLVHPYVRPQENANRTDVRWVTLTNSRGAGLRVVGLSGPLSVSAWPYTQADLAAARHTHELPVRKTITVNIDHKQMGVGGDNSWGARPHPEYLLPAKNYAYSFKLQAVAGK